VDEERLLRNQLPLSAGKEEGVVSAIGFNWLPVLLIILTA
jgi:hypothetical protein